MLEPFRGQSGTTRSYFCFAYTQFLYSARRETTKQCIENDVVQRARQIASVSMFFRVPSVKSFLLLSLALSLFLHVFFFLILLFFVFAFNVFNSFGSLPLLLIAFICSRLRSHSLILCVHFFPSTFCLLFCFYFFVLFFFLQLCVALFLFIFVSMWKTCSGISHGAWINYNVAKVIINILKCACARAVTQNFFCCISLQQLRN